MKEGELARGPGVSSCCIGGGCRLVGRVGGPTVPIGVERGGLLYWMGRLTLPAEYVCCCFVSTSHNNSKFKVNRLLFKFFLVKKILRNYFINPFVFNRSNINVWVKNIHGSKENINRQLFNRICLFLHQPTRTGNSHPVCK
jgi:hypothetical protein